VRAKDNERLTRVGPGTPMGRLLRSYWIPVVQSSELEPGLRAKRVSLLGERLVVYRTSSGKPAIAGEFCPHRLASLYFGRIEADGIRCVYHGWKFGTDGRCLEMPSQAKPFCDSVSHVAYPCAERGGVVWTYMGEGEPPPLPELEWTLLPAPNVFISKRVQECNWFQALEGGIDSSHIGFLHAPLDARDADTVKELDRASFGVGAAVQTGDKAPHFDVVDTDYGVLIGARRTWPDGRHYWRVSQFLMPFYTMPPTDMEAKIVQSHIWVPMNDTQVVNWMVTWHPERPLTREELVPHVEGKGSHVVDYAPPTSEPYGDIRTRDNRSNDYGMDWELHRTKMFCGIPGFGVQDQAIQESQGPTPTVDRTQEHLGPSDAGIMRVRKRLLDCAKKLDEGKKISRENPASFCVRSAAVVIAPGEDWVAGAAPRIVVRPGQQLVRG
jgi:phenylpropionate dioxygenase-like ring-hydroxylating dioxygenase large terminal subunit